MNFLQVLPQTTQIFKSHTMPDTPNVIRMFKTFVKEAVKYAKEGAPAVDPNEYRFRVRTCHQCPNLKNNTRCGLCGCVIEQKAKWKTAECPDGRWENYFAHGRKNNNSKTSK